MLMVTDLVGFMAGGVGGNDGNTKLLLHFDGADAATTTTDSSASGHAVTFVNQAQLDTAEKKFGGSSLLCGDGVDDYVYMEDSADWAFGTGDFTIDLWMKRAAVSGAQHNFCGQGNSGLTGGYTSFGAVLASNAVRFSFNDETYAASAGSIADTDWHHVACVRNGNNLAVAVDGSWGSNVDVTSVTMTDTATRFVIGQLGEFTAASSFNGWVDEFRISKGVARWSPGTSFTPPTDPYS